MWDCSCSTELPGRDRAVQHTAQTCANSLMPCSRAMGTPKPQGWGSAQLCWAHRTPCAQGKGLVKCSAPAALKVCYNLPWKKHSMTGRCCFRARLIQNTWSFSQQALQTGMAQGFRQELQKQIPFPFQLLSLWSKWAFYPDTVPKS